jgi:hypothetical protein
LQAHAKLTPQELDAAQAAVTPMADRLDLAQRLEPYADRRWPTQPWDGPILALDDVSAIPFLLNIAGVELYQHRARLRAGDNDFFAAITPVPPGYEEYSAGTLGLGSPHFLQATPCESLLAVAQACGEPPTRDELIGAAQARGHLGVHPYMGIESVWDLAFEIAARAGIPVNVLSPPPPVTWIANDKALFSEVVERTLGSQWLVETHCAVQPPEIAEALLALASRHRRVGLKRTRCASAMGNQVFESTGTARKKRWRWPGKRPRPHRPRRTGSPPWERDSHASMVSTSSSCRATRKSSWAADPPRSPPG